jgi:hypothetical protein
VQGDNMRKLSVLLILIILIGIMGCAVNPHMNVVDPTTLNTSISEEETAIVFLRQERPFLASGVELAAFIAGIWTFPIGTPLMFIKPSEDVFIFELDENKDLNFIVLLGFEAKFLHKTTPGKHLYTAINRENTNFLKADLEAGKTYYVYISHDYRWIALYPFIAITPFNLSSEKFLQEFKKFNWYENKDSVSEIVLEKKQEIMESSWFADQIKKYEETKLEDRNLLHPEYGTDTPLR